MMHSGRPKILSTLLVLLLWPFVVSDGHAEDVFGKALGGIIGQVRPDDPAGQARRERLQADPSALSRADQKRAVRERRAELQNQLNALDLDAGKADGFFGARTNAAIRRFQEKLGASPTGVLTNAQQSILSPSLFNEFDIRDFLAELPPLWATLAIKDDELAALTLAAPEEADDLSIASSIAWASPHFRRVAAEDGVVAILPSNRALRTELGADVRFASIAEAAELSRAFMCHTLSLADLVEAIGRSTRDGSEVALTAAGGECQLSLRVDAGSIYLKDVAGAESNIKAVSLRQNRKFYLHSDVIFENEVKPIVVATTAGAPSPMPQIRASRIFAGPEDYPPTDFAAYGILAARSKASEHDRARHEMICDAYVNSIAPVEALTDAGVRRGQQMVTVWPVDSRATAQALERQRGNSSEICATAVSSYSQLIGSDAVRQAEATGETLAGTGPYLLAWSPPSKKGASDAVVLSADLSDVIDYDVALSIMQGWVRDIESDPSLWSGSSWNIERARLKLQRWFDRHGTHFLTLLGAG